MTDQEHAEVISDEGRQLLERLELLLGKQIELVHQDNIGGFERLVRQAEQLVVEITGKGVLELAEFKDRRGKIERLYEDLSLAIASRMAEVDKDLRRIHQGKKTIGVYRKSI